MCARVDQDGNVIFSFKKFSKEAKLMVPKYNIGIGQKAHFIVQVENSYDVAEGIFGYVPAWAKEVKQILYNARSEGDNNPMDSRAYDGAMGIFEKPSFRDAIKKSRCVVPVSAFYEGPKEEKLKKPFRIYSKQEPVMYLAGLWGKHHDPKKNETFVRFSIITTPSIDITESIGHHRCPMLLHEEFIERWLDTETSRAELEDMMRMRWQPEGMVSEAIVPGAMRNTDSEVPLPVNSSLF